MKKQRKVPIKKKTRVTDALSVVPDIEGFVLGGEQNEAGSACIFDCLIKKILTEDKEVLKRLADK